MSTITKQMVVAALLELRVNRKRRLADRHIRTLLRMYGDGATSVHNLDPRLYAAVYRAAGGIMAGQCATQAGYAAAARPARRTEGLAMSAQESNLQAAHDIVRAFNDSLGGPDASSPYAEPRRQMLHTVLIVGAIDRLTEAMRNNTLAIREAADLAEPAFVETKLGHVS